MEERKEASGRQLGRSARPCETPLASPPGTHGTPFVVDPEYMKRCLRAGESKRGGVEYNESWRWTESQAEPKLGAEDREGECPEECLSRRK